jgi:hypothetical protein
MLNVLLIEADNQRNLGGSCVRDLKNIDSYLDKCSIERRSTIVLSICDISNIRMKNEYLYDSLTNYKNIFDKFCDDIKDGDSAFIMISGHGYQKYQKYQKCDNKELDGMDEYISYNNGIITDNDIYQLLIKKIKKKCKRIVCLSDTCHSGTMFDLDNNDNNDNKNTISLSGCQDNELSSCDISDVGFGGSLTVHLLSINNSLNKLLNSDIEEIRRDIYDSLKSILKFLGQVPILNYI